MPYRCKGRCVYFVGYERGHYHFQIEDKGYCSECHYKILTLDKMCGCCGSTYRRKRRKDYPHFAGQSYHIVSVAQK